MTPADFVLLTHFAIAAYIVGGFLLVGLGQAAHWRWTRRPWFRYTHLTAIAFVAVTAALGIPCPLTVLESTLRGRETHASFVGYWVSRLLYYDLPPWVFTAAYVGLALGALAALRWAPPQRRRAAGSLP